MANINRTCSDLYRKPSLDLKPYPCPPKPLRKHIAMLS